MHIYFTHICKSANIFYNHSHNAESIPYTRWGSKDCPNNDKNLFSGHIVCVENDFVCLSDEQFRFLTRRIQLKMEGVSDANGNNVPCAMCEVANVSIVRSMNGFITCPRSWFREYEGFMAANPDYPQEYICVDKAYTELLPGSLDYVGSGNARVPCIVCSV